LNHNTETIRQRIRMATFLKGKLGTVSSICVAAMVAQVFGIGIELVVELKS
jgi:hypothetical protein